MTLQSLKTGDIFINDSGLYISDITTTKNYPSDGLITITFVLSSSVARTGSFNFKLFGKVDSVIKVTVNSGTVQNNANDSVTITEGTAQYSFVLNAVEDLGCGYAYDEIDIYITGYTEANQGGTATSAVAYTTTINNLNWVTMIGDIDVDEPDRAEDVDVGWHFKFTTGTFLKDTKVHFRIFMYHETSGYGYLDSDSPDSSQNETWKLDDVDVTSTGITIGTTANTIECYSDNTNSPYLSGDFSYDIKYETVEE